MLLEILKAILFGIVEGITEWLPISSTGHMILLDQVVKLNVSADFSGSYPAWSNNGRSYIILE